MPGSYPQLLAQARNLGIKNAHELSPSELRTAVAMYLQMRSLRDHAEVLGIVLPEDVQNLGALQRTFRQEVTKRLEGVKKGDTVTYGGEEWVVQGIHPHQSPANEHSSATYILRPVKGGRVQPLANTALLRVLMDK